MVSSFFSHQHIFQKYKHIFLSWTSNICSDFFPNLQLSSLVEGRTFTCNNNKKKSLLNRQHLKHGVEEREYDRRRKKMPHMMPLQ